MFCNIKIPVDEIDLCEIAVVSIHRCFVFLMLFSRRAPKRVWCEVDTPVFIVPSLELIGVILLKLYGGFTTLFVVNTNEYLAGDAELFNIHDEVGKKDKIS